MSGPDELEGEYRPTVLVVDDSEVVRAHVRDLLEAAPLRAHVTEVNDGAEALRQALSNPYDCVICDIMMPVMDGIKFVQSVRKRHSRLALPVLFLTVKDALENKIEGFSAGASDFIVKPFLDEEFLARVETHVQLARLYRNSAEQNLRLQVMARTDSLTEIANRRAFMERLHGEFSRARRKDTPLSLCLLDLDHFKGINDRLGHQMGDRVLVATAKVLSSSGRRYDFVGRVGGEEFGIILPECTLQEAQGVAGRMRQKLAQIGIDELKPGEITGSFGIANTQANATDSVESLYARADGVLYDAKESGRNQVRIAETPKPPEA